MIGKEKTVFILSSNDIVQAYSTSLEKVSHSKSLVNSDFVKVYNFDESSNKILVNEEFAKFSKPKYWAYKPCTSKEIQEVIELLNQEYNANIKDMKFHMSNRLWYGNFGGNRFFAYDIKSLKNKPTQVERIK